MYNALPSSLTDRGLTGDGGYEELDTSQDDGTLYHLERLGILTLAVDEIKLCQRLSAGPNFVVSNDHGRVISMKPRPLVFPPNSPQA